MTCQRWNKAELLKQTNRYFSNNRAPKADAMEVIGIDDPTKIHSALLQLRSAGKIFRNSSLLLLHRSSLLAV